MILVKIFLAGLFVLIVAVVMNLVAGAIGLKTWYSFLNQVSQGGFTTAVQELKGIEIFFLLLLYPFFLGLAAYLVFILTASLPR